MEIMISYCEKRFDTANEPTWEQCKELALKDEEIQLKMAYHKGEEEADKFEIPSREYFLAADHYYQNVYGKDQGIEKSSN